MLAFELVVMREVSKSNLCFEITLVGTMVFFKNRKKKNLFQIHHSAEQQFQPPLACTRGMPCEFRIS